MIKKIENILILIVALVLVVVFLRMCGEPKYIKGKETVTVQTKTDTVYATQLIYVNKWKVTKVYDSIVKVDNSICRIYYDSIPDSNQTIYYKAVATGFLDSIQLSYKLKIPLKITTTIEKNTTRIDTIKPPKNMIYGGLEWNSTKYNLSPYITITNKNLAYTVKYGLNDESFSLGVAFKIYQK